MCAISPTCATKPISTRALPACNSGTAAATLPAWNLVKSAARLRSSNPTCLRPARCTDTRWTRMTSRPSSTCTSKPAGVRSKPGSIFSRSPRATTPYPFSSWSRGTTREPTSTADLSRIGHGSTSRCCRRSSVRSAIDAPSRPASKWTRCMVRMAWSPARMVCGCWNCCAKRGSSISSRSRSATTPSGAKTPARHAFASPVGSLRSSSREKPSSVPISRWSGTAALRARTTWSPW